MKLGKRLDEIFNSVLVAFTKKYERVQTPCCSIEHHKFTKDLKHLIEMREKQVRNHSRQIALSIDNLTPTQIEQIKDRFNE